MAIITPKNRNGSFAWQGVQEFAGGISTESVFGLTATGNNQATATPLSSSYTEFTTVAANTGAILPVATVGGHQYMVDNSGASDLYVYPSLGANIDGMANNAPYTVPAGTVVMFLASTYNSGSDSYNYKAVELGNGASTPEPAYFVNTYDLNHKTPETITAPTADEPVGVFVVQAHELIAGVPQDDSIAAVVSMKPDTGNQIEVTATFPPPDLTLQFDPSSGQTIANNSDVLIQIGVPTINTGTWTYDATSITIPQDGRYRIDFYSNLINGLTSQDSRIEIRVNGSNQSSQENAKGTPNGSGFWQGATTVERDLVAGDVLTFIQYQNSGAPLNTVSSSVRVKMEERAATFDARVTLAFLSQTSGGGGSGGVPTFRQVIAGNGLTGGGTLASDVTLDAVAHPDGSIVVNPNNIQVGILASDAQHGTRGGGTIHAAATTSTAGFMSAVDKTKVDYWVNVIDYGADPTGVADSWAAFTAAMNDIPIGSRRYGILIPAGLYYLSKTWYINRPVQIRGKAPRSAAAGGTQIQGQKGFDVFRVQFSNHVIAGGGAGSIIEGLSLNHQSGTAVWVSGAAGYVANQSAIIPTAGYLGHWDNYDVNTPTLPFVLRCVQGGTSGVIEPTWASYDHGINILPGFMARASNIVTATTSVAHGLTTGDSVYIRAEDSQFNSGFFTVTVVDADTFTYSDPGANATSAVLNYLADVIPDGTVRWIKVHIAALHMEAGASVYDLNISNTGGEGFLIDANSGVGTNANGFRIQNGTVSTCLGWGVVARNFDSNGGNITGIFGIQNGWGTGVDASVLGNQWIGCGAENNGLGIIAPGIGPAIVVPDNPATNRATIVGTYTEGGQRSLINAGAMYLNDTSGDVYGSGVVLTSSRSNGLVFVNDTNDDDTGLGVTFRIAQAGSQLLYRYSFSNFAGPATEFSMGPINGNAANVGWVGAYNATQTMYMHSIDGATDTYRSETVNGGHFWIPNMLYRGPAPTLNSRQIARSSGPPTTSTWIQSDRSIELSTQVTGAVEFACVATGTPGTWAPIQAAYSYSTSGSTTSDIRAHYLGVTSLGSDVTITLSQSAYAGVEITIKDETNTAGTAGFVINIVPGGAETIDGSTSAKVIAKPGGSIRLKRRGGNWFTVSGDNQGVGASPRTTALTLTSNQRHRMFHNTGATAQVVFTLPSAPVIGDYYDFYVTDTDGIRVLAQGSHQIRVLADLSAAAGYTESATIGSSIRILYLSSNLWVASYALGTWTTV